VREYKTRKNKSRASERAYRKKGLAAETAAACSSTNATASAA